MPLGANWVRGVYEREYRRIFAMRRVLVFLNIHALANICVLVRRTNYSPMIRTQSSHQNPQQPSRDQLVVRTVGKQYDDQVVH